MVFASPSDFELFQDVNIHFAVSHDADLDEEKEQYFFQAVLQTPYIE